MRNILAWEIKQRHTYIMWWSIATFLLMIMLVSLYPSIHKEAAQLNQVMAQLPESIRAMRGSSDITSPVGYLNGELYYMTLPMLYIIMSIGLGASILAKDEQAHTLELLLSRPVSRGALLFAKAMSVVVIVFFVGSISFVTTYVLGRIIGLDVGFWHLLVTNVYCLLFSLAFGAIAFLFTATSIARRASIGLATLLAFGGYLLVSMSSLAEWVNTVSKAFPYHYYNPYQLLLGHMSAGLNIFLATIFGVVAIFSYMSFRRRDIE